MKIDAPLQAEALRVLRGIPGMIVSAREPKGADGGVDAVLRYAGSQAHVTVEYRRRANAATAWQMVHHAAAHPGAPLLLVADQTTASAREILADHGIGVLDGLGNAHLEFPGLLIHLQGRRRPRRAAHEAPPTRLRGKAGVAAQALLLHPERTWRVHALAEEAGISAALAHRVLARLEVEGIVAAEGAGPNRVRRVANPTALLDLWAEEQVEQPTRVTGYALAQSPQQLMRGVATNLARNRIDYALTGAAAASLLAPFVTAIPVVDVWVTGTASSEHLYDGAQADPVAEGHNIIFLQAKDDTPLAFRETADDLWLVNRFRLYADLRRDPRRGREQADHLRREVIGF